MYAYLTGTLTHKDPAQAILDVGGVGYHLRISVYTYEQIKDTAGSCRLFCWLHVKEDAHTLFGFAHLAEKALFLHLVSVSGIGPGTALMMLSWLTPQDLHQAIRQGDVKTVQGIKGIGPKTAQRVLLELQDKLQKENWMVAAGLPEGSVASIGVSAEAPMVPGKASLSGNPSQRRNHDEALAALLVLGIPKAQAERNIETVIAKAGAGELLTVEEMVKRSLRG